MSASPTQRILLPKSRGARDAYRESERQFLEVILRSLSLFLVVLSVGCSDGTTEVFPPPGMVIITPRVGAPANGQASILLRSDQPARVVVASEDSDTAEVYGTGRSGRFVTSLRFQAPDFLSGGATTEAVVIAVSEGGMRQVSSVTLVGLGQIEVQPLTQEFIDIAAVAGRAVLSAPHQLWIADRGADEPSPTSVSGEVQAITADEGNDSVLVAGAGAVVSSFRVEEGGLSFEESFEFAIYDGSSQPVSSINALHVNGELVAGATDRGMTIVDRALVEPEPFCRRRSAMTTKLAPATHDPSMHAVAATTTERVVAGGAYLNVYEAYDDTDGGTCIPPMSNRGTSVIAPPEGGTEPPPWRTVAVVLTEAYLWIGRADGGVLRLPYDFELIESRYFRDGDLWQLGADELPLPVVNDIAAGDRNNAWIALEGSDGVSGGLLMLDPDIVETAPDSRLWLDASALGGIPIALDVDVASGQVWTLSPGSIAVFSDS